MSAKLGQKITLKHLPVVFLVFVIVLLSGAYYSFGVVFQRADNDAQRKLAQTELLHIQYKLEQEVIQLDYIATLLRDRLEQQLTASLAPKTQQDLNAIAEALIEPLQRQYQVALYNGSLQILTREGEVFPAVLNETTLFTNIKPGVVNNNQLHLRLLLPTSEAFTLATGAAHLLVSRTITSEMLSQTISPGNRQKMEVVITGRQGKIRLSPNLQVQAAEHTQPVLVPFASLQLMSLQLTLEALMTSGNNILAFSWPNLWLLGLLGLAVGFSWLLSQTVFEPLAQLRKGAIKQLRYHVHESVDSVWKEIPSISTNMGRMGNQVRTERISSRKKLLKRTMELHSNIVSLKELSWRDPLTNLYNRRAFAERAEEQLSLAIRNNIDCAVVMMDLDHFKAINDEMGHAVGDQILKHLATVVKSQLRKSDIIARIGGEEFCMLLPEDNAAGAKTLIERIRKKIDDTGFFVNDKGRVCVTCSFGIAQLNQHTQSIGKLQKHADIALYYAKRNGRNNVVHFDDMPKEKQHFG